MVEKHHKAVVYDSMALMKQMYTLICPMYANSSSIIRTSMNKDIHTKRLRISFDQPVKGSI